MIKNFVFFFLFVFSFHSFAGYEDFADNHWRKHDNTITIQVIPASYRLQWITPQSLIWSLLKNQYWFPITRSNLGHVTAELNCNINGVKEKKLLGQSTKDLNAFREHLKNGYGFSILNRPHLYSDLPLVNVPGKLDDPKDLIKRFDRLIKKDHLFLVSFKISGESCQNALEFMKSYEQKTSSTNLAGNIYGFGAEPLNFEGAGCATFVQSLLKLSGLEDYAHIMEQEVYVSEKLLGVPKKDKKVSIWDLLFTSERIDQVSEKSRSFKFPDPQAIVDHFYPIFKEDRDSKIPVLEREYISNSKAAYIFLNAVIE